jgi:hypothetical protein
MSKYKYEYVDQVLGSYFSILTEESDDEAIDSLKKAVASSPEWAGKLLSELHQAFSDPTYSWVEVFEEHQVPYVAGVEVSEAEAREYALRLFTPIDPTLPKQ